MTAAFFSVRVCKGVDAVPSESVPDLVAPLGLVLDLTSRCNLRCAYCCFFSNPEESCRTDMDPDSWVELIQEAARLRVLRVVLRGGEAMLSPAFERVVAAVVENRMRFALMTNGLIFSSRAAEKIAATGRCDYVKISLDGPEAVHDELRGRGAHAGALAGIAAARNAGLRLHVTCAVHRRNFRRLPEIVDYMTGEMGLERISFSAVTECEQSQWALSEEDFHEAMHLLRQAEHPAMVYSGMYGNLIHWRKQLRGEEDCSECRQLRTRLSVLADGTFVPCPSLSGSSLGRMGEDTLAEAWSRLAARKELLRRRSPSRECGECRFASVCHGFCPAVYRRENAGSWRFFCLKRHVEAYGVEL